MRRVTLWPRGLVGRVTLVLLAAVIVQFAGAAVLFGSAERNLNQTEIARRIAEQVVVTERILDTIPDDERAEVISHLSTEHIRVFLSEAPPPVSDRAQGTLADIRSEIEHWEPKLADRDLRLSIVRIGATGLRTSLEGGLALQDGSWLRFRMREALSGWATAVGTLLWVATIAVIVLVLAVVLVRTLGAPLRALASAADSIGDAPTLVSSKGPRELRHLARALNAMQQRIADLIESRTNALAAVSHDLRTPLARMRLRIAERPAEGERPQLLGDIEEMETMLDSLLDFLSGAEESEALRKVNLASLVQTVVDDARDLGARARYEGPDRATAMIRQASVKRALANIVDNAAKYGRHARVFLEESADTHHIRVEDDGPGIPEDEIGRVTRPFYRSDKARGRDTRGFGLGLAVAQQVAHSHKGSLLIENRSPRGLRVTLMLPRNPEA